MWKAGVGTWRKVRTDAVNGDDDTVE
jgi:hypothetical protein